MPFPPADLDLTTLLIRNVDETTDEEDLENALLAYGKLKGFKIVHKQGIAFACFFDRVAAEQAIKCLFDKFFLNSKRL